MLSFIDISKMSVSELRRRIISEGGHVTSKAKSRLYLEKYLLDLCRPKDLDGIAKHQCQTIKIVAPKAVRTSEPVVIDFNK